MHPPWRSHPAQVQISNLVLSQADGSPSGVQFGMILLEGWRQYSRLAFFLTTAFATFCGGNLAALRYSFQRFLCFLVWRMTC